MEPSSSNLMEGKKTCLNPEFLEYISENEIVSTDETNEFIGALMTPLPICFRINILHPLEKSIRNKLMTYFQFRVGDYVAEGSIIHPPVPLEWYPFENSAWIVDCEAISLSRAGKKFPLINELHVFLKEMTACGAIARQEAVSMLPVCYFSPFNKRNRIRILDICSAPGSKTKQLIEKLGIFSSSEEHFIVANDNNRKRGYLLVDQLQHSNMMSTVVTNHDGGEFPGMYEDGKFQKQELFDYVLCDVPCSGDGTGRKNRNLWKNWEIGNSLSLFFEQIKIALRCIELLKVGGEMIYSTCSLNPIENEAVIQTLLGGTMGSTEIVPLELRSDFGVKNIKQREGKETWKVGYKKMRKKSKQQDNTKKCKAGDSSMESSKIVWFDSFDQVPAKLKKNSRIVEAMFPQESSSTKSTLKKCSRFLPHDMNTGGFFIAKIRKVGIFTRAEEVFSNIVESGKVASISEGYICKLCNIPGHYIKDCEISKKIHSSEKLHAVKCEHPKFQNSYELLWKSYRDIFTELCNFFGLPQEYMKDYLHIRVGDRTEKSLNGVHFVCPAISNAFNMKGDAYIKSSESSKHGFGHLNVVKTGAKVFVRIKSNEGCDQEGRNRPISFRPTEEGISFLLPYIGNRMVIIDSFEEFNVLLDTVLQTLQGDERNVISMQGLSKSIQNQCKALEHGPIIFTIRLGVERSEELKKVALNALLNRDKHSVTPRASIQHLEYLRMVCLNSAD